MAEQINFTIEKRGEEYCLISAEGKSLGCHPTREAAVEQEQVVKAQTKGEFKHFQTFNINNHRIFSTGIWNGITITLNDLNEIVRNFSKVSFESPLFSKGPITKLGHNDKQEEKFGGQPALGWLSGLKVVDNGLFADFKEMPLKVYEAIKRGNFKRLSPEIYMNYSNNGTVFGKVLRAVALLGADIPANTDTETLEALYSQNENVMLFTDYKSLTKEDKDMSEVTDLQNKIKALEFQYASLKDEKFTEQDKELGALKSSVTGFEEKINTLIKENKEEKERRVESEARFKEQKETAQFDKIKAFIKKEKEDGHILPRFEKQVENLLKSAANEETIHTFTDKDSKEIKLTQFECLENLISGLPKLVEFDELAKVSADLKKKIRDDKTTSMEGSAEGKLNKMAEDLVASGEAKDFSEAINKVMADHSELLEEYKGKG